MMRVLTLGRCVAIAGGVAAAASIVSLSGCAGSGSASPSGSMAVAAESEQAATTDTRQRAKVHTELGGLYLQERRMAIALEEARVAMEADPNYAPAHNLYAMVNMYLQENALAEEAFERALRLAPGDPEINNNYGWFLCISGREQRALTYFQSSYRNTLNQNPAKALTNAGICSLRLKDDVAAEQLFNRARMMDNVPNAQATYHLADINFRKGRLDLARQYLNELHRMADPSAESLWLAVRVERKLGDREQEARYSSQLRRKFPGSPEQQRLLQGQYE